MIVVLAFFLVHVARTPSEPFISVNVVGTNAFGRPPNETISTGFWNPTGGWDATGRARNIELSNRMSFSLVYWIESGALRSEDFVYVMEGSNRTYVNRYRYSLIAAHSQTSLVLLCQPSGAKTLSVSFERKLKPIELRFIKTFPWLKRHYPFNRRRSFTIYGPVSDVQVPTKPQNER
jgi:hypothetical protein